MATKTIHDLTNKSSYPNHHVWESEKKLNVISNKEINQFDRVLINGDEFIIGAICKKDHIATYLIESLANANENSQFFELKIL